jgi:hypothetical protein
MLFAEALEEEPIRKRGKLLIAGKALKMLEAFAPKDLSREPGRVPNGGVGGRQSACRSDRQESGGGRPIGGHRGGFWVELGCDSQL